MERPSNAVPKQRATQDAMSSACAVKAIIPKIPIARRQIREAIFVSAKLNSSPHLYAFASLFVYL